MPLESSFSTSTSLIERVKHQDAEAWRRLVLIYGPVVFQWSRRAGLQGHDAADIVQQVFQTVATTIARFRHEQPTDSFRGWLWSVFHSRLMDFYRKGKRSPALPGRTWQDQLPDPASLDSESTVESSEKLLLMQGALQAVRGDFSEKTWQAFWRSVALSEPTSTIANELGMTSAAVCMCRARVLRRLRETIHSLGGGPNEFT